MAMSNVQRIQCGSPEVRTRTRRVGAYCRVSTLLESQQLSLETQMEGFKQKIAKTPGWKLVDIYADEGITGTSTKKRKEFRRMIQDAQDGKIDTIITKSISRFARNTLDCLKYHHIQHSLHQWVGGCCNCFLGSVYCVKTRTSFRLGRSKRHLRSV